MFSIAEAHGTRRFGPHRRGSFLRVLHPQEMETTGLMGLPTGRLSPSAQLRTRPTNESPADRETSDSGGYSPSAVRPDCVCD